MRKYLGFIKHVDFLSLFFLGNVWAALIMAASAITINYNSSPMHSVFSRFMLTVFICFFLITIPLLFSRLNRINNPQDKRLSLILTNLFGFWAGLYILVPYLKIYDLLAANIKGTSKELSMLYACNYLTLFMILPIIIIIAVIVYKSLQKFNIYVEKKHGIVS